MSETTDFLVTYDVADDRVRRKLFKLLKGYGEWAQRSVFVCALDARRRQRLERAIARLPLAAADRCAVLTLHRPLPATVQTGLPARTAAVLVCE